MPAASPVANLTDFLIFHLQHGNDFALHTHTHCPLRSLSKCPSQVLTLLPWANSYLIQNQGSLCPAASRASDWDHSAASGFRRTEFTHHSLTSDPGRWTQSTLPDNECNQQNGLSKKLKSTSECSVSPTPPLMLSVCIFNHLLWCVSGRDMFGFGGVLSEEVWVNWSNHLHRWVFLVC